MPIPGTEPSRQQWRWLGAIALEQVLGKPILARLGEPQQLDAFLAAEVRQGRLQVVGPGEVALPAELEQQVLRHLAARGELEELARATGKLLDARSVSHVTMALQWGEWEAFTRGLSARRTPRTGGQLDLSAWLRRSVCEAFDPEWLRQTWKDRTTFVVERVLADALDGPTATGALVPWVEGLGAEERAPFAELLFQHALLSGDLARLRREDPHDLARDRAQDRPRDRAREAAVQLVSGDLAGAARMLEGAFEGALRHGQKRYTPASYGTAAPPLAMLAWSREDEAGRELGRKLLAAGTRDAERAAARAFRVLAKYLAQPSTEQRRIDVHQFGAEAPAWELLIHAFTVHLHLQQPWARASWAQRIGQKAAEWRGAGFHWLSEQAASLARALNKEYADKECRDLPAAKLPLWGLIEPKPDWQRALEVLSAVTEHVAESAERTVRVAWFADLADGTLQRPALQEHRPGQGFAAGQRLSIGELWERRAELPDEDARVLEQSRETRAGRRELLPDAWEVLIGHPRVFDGARGMKPVDVVRGTCRVVTRDEPGHLRIEVEPAGLPPGLGVFARPEGSRLVVYRVTPAIRKVIDALPHGARIPKTHEAEVVAVLGRLAEVVEVHSPALGAHGEVAADPKPRLRFSPASGAWRVLLGVRPFGERGRFFLAGHGPRSLTQHAEGRQLRCVRDLERERALCDELLAASPTLSRDGRAESDEGDEGDARETTAALDEGGWLLGEADVLAVLSELRAAGVTAGLEWPESRSLSVRATVTVQSLHGKVQRLRGRKGWYLATGGLRLDDVTSLSLGELLRAPAIGNGRFLRLPDGDYVEVEERIRRAMSALRARASARGEIVIHQAAFATLRETIAGGLEVEPSVDGWLARVREVETKTWPLPEGLEATLRSYQWEGFQWLCRASELGLGVCLADDMGLGKTLQVIALLLHRREQGPALVVAPTSVCSNWARELSRFAPSLRVHHVSEWKKSLGELGAGDVLICSYAMLQQEQAALTSRTFATAALDEAQFIKNPDSLRARAAFQLQADQRVALTGTPVENHYGDLWSIFHFLLPGLLGDFATFKRRFIQPIESGSSANDSPGDAPEAVLRQLVSPFVLRRKKEEVLAELPPLTEVWLEVQLPERDELRYGLLRKQIHDKLFTPSGRRHSKLQVLAELTRLRRFCCHPRLVFPEAEPSSAKIDAFLDLAEELRENGHRALVFSQYVDFLGLLREQLDERGLRYEYLDGSTPAGARQARVDAFQQGDAPFFLISLKAGGFGLNLTGADYVIHLDPWWNPAVEAQATDRAHRIGQERPVTVYRLVAKNTIEEKIVELHGKKKRLARALLDESDGNVTAEELLRVLG